VAATEVKRMAAVAVDRQPLVEELLVESVAESGR
jgi:hypothetical protein